MGIDRDLQFKNLYHENFRLIFLICNRYTHANRDEAYDLVQVVFTKIVEKFHTLRDSKKTKSWIIAIAHNEGKTHVRKQALDRSLKERFTAWIRSLGSDQGDGESSAEEIHGAVRNYSGPQKLDSITPLNYSGV